MFYYKRHIGDYVKKTAHLSPLEHGIYNLILDSYYDREKAPTLMEATRWARARTEDEKAAVLGILDEFFTQHEDGTYRNSRVEEELAAYKDLSETNRQIAIKREEEKRKKRELARLEHDACTYGSPGEARNEHGNSTVGAPNQEPRTNNRGTRLPPDWAPPQEYIDHCKKTRPDLNADSVAEDFKNYWIAKSGKDATKVDWLATWKTWVKKQFSPRSNSGFKGQEPDDFSEQFQGVKW